MSEHQTIPIKVTAWVDKEIAPLVLALNEFSNVITVDSCQGGDGEPAYVYFVFQDDIGAPSFAERLAEEFRLSLETWNYQVSLNWHGERDRAMGEITCAPEAIPDVAAAIKEMRRNESP